MTTDIRALLRARLQTALEEDRQQFLNPMFGKQAYAMSPASGPSHDPLEADHEAMSLGLADAREALARRDFIGIQEELAELLEEHGIPDSKRTELGMGLLEIAVKVHEQALAQLTGRYSALVDDATADTLRNGSSDSNEPSQLFSVAASAYVRDMVTHAGWTGQTRSQNEMTFKKFVEVCGDRPVRCYVRRDVAAFYDVLKALPSLWSKGREWKGMTLREIVQSTANEEHRRMSMKTIKRHFSALGGLFDTLISREDYEGANPAHNFKFPENKRANKKRLMWEGRDLEKLLASPVWTGCRSARFRGQPGEEIIEGAMYWLPLLALYHGNRLEEFAQLQREDVCEEDGIWFMDITDEGERQTKNEASNRRVPLHPRIESLGFLSYVERITKAPSDRVFPSLVPGGADSKYGHSFSKRWKNYREKVGVYRKGLDYHSFRHGVVSKLYEAEVPEAQIEELVGHEGGGTSRKVYKKKSFKLSTLKEAISKVEWPEENIAPPEVFKP